MSVDYLPRGKFSHFSSSPPTTACPCIINASSPCDNMTTMQGQRPARPAARHYMTDTSVVLVDRRPVPAPNNNLNISLSSNNPFRRGVSPNTSATAKGPAPAPPTTNGAFINNENEPFRSTNPFLDNYQAPSYPISIPAQNARQSPSRQMPAHGYSQSASPKKAGFHVSGAPPTKMMVCLPCLSFLKTTSGDMDGEVWSDGVM